MSAKEMRKLMEAVRPMEAEEEFDWNSEMETGVVIQDNTRGGYDVGSEGKFIGHFDDMDEALVAIDQWMKKNQYFPNIFFVNDHGNVTHIDQEGNEIQSIVEINKPQQTPKITTTYEIVTPESAEQGDAEERGWIDEEGVDMTPDKYDIEDGETVVSKAVEFLQNEGASEPSSSAFDVHVWYSDPDGNQNYRTGATEYRSYHLNGFTPEDAEAIYNQMTQRSRPMTEESPMKHDDFTTAYIEAALWSSTDNSDETGGDPLDKKYSPDDLSDITMQKMMADCASFQEKAWDDISENEKDAGHDFWLTRNSHGAGFWDGDWPEDVGHKLSELSQSYGQYELYIGDDGKIYGY